MDEKITKEEVKETKPIEPDASLLAKIKDLEKQVETFKGAMSRANTETADYKRKYMASLDESKRKEEEQAEAYKAMQDELTALRTEKRISTYQAKLMASGYDAQTASTMAVNLPEGIGDDFFNSQKTFLEAQKQAAKAEALNKQPGLPSGTPPKPADAEAAELSKILHAAGVK